MKIGMKKYVKATGISSKRLNENLKPLERFLRAQLGRRWNDIYSEVAATLAPGHVVKEHVRQHLDDFVERRIVIQRDGAWLGGSSRPRFGRGAPWRQPFYVDPANGILKESANLWKSLGIDPQPWKRRAPANPDIRVLDETRELRRIDGIWFEVLFHREPDALAWVYDLIKRTLVPAAEKHAIAKRQLARSELLAHGIANHHN